MEAMSGGAIVLQILKQFLPVWIALVVTFALSIGFKRRLGLYGKLFDSSVGMVGYALVMFWVFTALFAPWIVTHDTLAQMSQMKNAVPGEATPNGMSFYLLGGDHLGRDVGRHEAAARQEPRQREKAGVTGAGRELEEDVSASGREQVDHPLRYRPGRLPEQLATPLPPGSDRAPRLSELLRAAGQAAAPVSAGMTCSP